MAYKLESASQVMLGGLYKANPDRVGGERTNGHEQNYGLFVAVEEEETGDVWMVDTYHISSPSMNRDWEGETAAERFINGFLCDPAPKSKWFVSKCRYDCYYNACVQLTERNCREFELLGVLSDYREVPEREALEYAPEDVLSGVKLWREHAYPMGIFLVRRDAEVSLSRRLDSRLADIYATMKSPYIRWDKTELERLRAQLDDYDDVKLRAAYHLFSKAEELQDEWNKLYRDVRRLEATGELDSFDTWEQGVPASDICA